MAGGSINYTQYTCPHCGSTLGNDALLYAKEEGKCIVCRERISIDFNIAIQETLETKANVIFAFIAFTLLAMLIVYLLGNFANYDWNTMSDQSKVTLFFICLFVGMCMTALARKFN